MNVCIGKLQFHRSVSSELYSRIEINIIFLSLLHDKIFIADWRTKIKATLLYKTTLSVNKGPGLCDEDSQQKIIRVSQIKTCPTL